MTIFIRMTAFASIVAAASLAASEAAAAPVAAGVNATAKLRVLRPLQLTSKQNLDLGIIVLSGSGAYSSTVGISKDGTTFNCDSNSGKILCSGTHQAAIYNVSGTKSQAVTIAAGNVTLSDGAGHNLTLTPDFSPTVTLANSGAPGSDFNVGGSIVVTNATADGVYTGTFAVTADYQ
jgi:Mat/Ecp fimbriae major subunit